MKTGLARDFKLLKSKSLKQELKDFRQKPKCVICGSILLNNKSKYCKPHAADRIDERNRIASRKI